MKDKLGWFEWCLLGLALLILFIIKKYEFIVPNV